MAAQSEQEVQAYLDTHKIQATVEEAINACVKANAADPCLFMSQHLASKAAPETITKIWARQIFDSRGNPTVEVDVTTTKSKYTAAVPSGASTGIYEGARRAAASHSRKPSGCCCSCSDARRCARSCHSSRESSRPHLLLLLRAPHFYQQPPEDCGCCRCTCCYQLPLVARHWRPE